ncbi:cytochrome P450 [Marasmius fiardii PR-910]|nr:cytochrome P450 [Marasmius fiardii PR-910]
MLHRYATQPAMTTVIPLWPSVAATLVIILVLSRRRERISRNYPPGPEPRLFVGNLFDLAKSKPWKAFRDLGRIYGDLIHFEVIGKHIVVINSRSLANRMFEKPRGSQIYSDRPSIPIIELMGWMPVNTSILRYGPDWRVHRRVYNQAFRATVVSDYQPIVLSKVSDLLTNLNQRPEFFIDHIKTYAAATILGTAYGYDVAPSNDKLVQIAEEAARTSSDAAHPSAAVASILPFLCRLPLEFPIFAFQRLARKTRRLIHEMRTVPYEFVKNDIATGRGNTSLLAEFLEKNTANGGDKHQEDLIRNALTTAYAAGAETSVSVLMTFLLAMALHPEIQERAQHELDTVIERGRLPTYADRSDLPYIEAILRETLRWSPVVPLGIFHSTLSDDVIDGYFIPKGAIVIGNIWSMTRDEAVYSEPESFKPERFLNEGGTCNEDQMVLPFGFGRRICAGRHFAILVLWTAMASVLAQFEIGQPEDEAGRPIRKMTDHRYTDGMISQPHHFRCMVKPRLWAASITKGQRLNDEKSD